MKPVCPEHGEPLRMEVSLHYRHYVWMCSMCARKAFATHGFVCDAEFSRQFDRILDEIFAQPTAPGPPPPPAEPGTPEHAFEQLAILFGGRKPT